jgi:hypothetical protein
MLKIPLFILGTIGVLVVAPAAEASDSGWRLSADERLERCVVTPPNATDDNREVETDCCTILADGSALTPGCESVARALDGSPQQKLRRALAVSTRNTIAQFLRSNPDSSIGSFTIDLPSTQIQAHCCVCKPSQSFCGDGSYNFCDPPTSTGLCPSDRERWICVDSTIACVPVD